MEADELLVLVAGGDQKAFEDLYGLVSGPVYGLVRRVVRDPAQSEEVAQEVLLELWCRAARFDPGRGSALSWVLILAHRRAVDRVRSARAAGERERRRTPLFVPFATATAAAALVVAALFAVQADGTRERLDAERGRSREIAHVLAAPDARVSSGRDTRGRTIGVIASASTRSAVVTLGGHGDPPNGRVRQLWLMGPDARPRSLGLFEGGAPLVASGLDTAAASLAVTVEPDGGSPRPTSRPIVQLALETVGFGE